LKHPKFNDILTFKWLLVPQFCKLKFTGETEKYISSIYEIPFVTSRNYMYLQSPFSSCHCFYQQDFANRPKEQLTAQTSMLTEVTDNAPGTRSESGITFGEN